MLPNLNPIERQYAQFVLSSTFTFWQETDEYPIFDKPHKELFGEMDRAMPDMSQQRAKPHAELLLAPRFSFKSYGAGKAIARMVLANPNISIGIFRSTREEARKQLRVVKHILSANAKVRRYFGDQSLGAEKWDEDEILVSTRTIARSDPTVFTMGMGGTSTGNHPDLIFADDLVTEQNCDSVREQEVLWTLVEAFQPLLPSWGSLLITGTRWSEIDCYGRILDLNAAAVRAGKPEPFKPYVKQVYEQREDGSLDLYFPAYLTEERLEDIRSKVDVRKYNAWFFNRMVDPSEKIFKSQDILKFNGPFTFDFPYKRSVTLEDPQFGGEVVPLYVVFKIDPSLTDERGSCGYGLTVTGYDRRKNWYVLESRQLLALPSRAQEVIGDLLLTYRPHRIILESAGGDAGLVTWIGGFIERNKLDCIVQAFSAMQHEVRGQRGKVQRINAMEPIVRDHKVMFRVASSVSAPENERGYCADLLRQIDAWPSVTVNDAIDSWSMGRYALRWVPTEEEDFEYVEDRSNPPEWDISWTDAAGRVHGLPAEKASKLALGPPPGMDAERWLTSLETGERAAGYRPGARTAEYLRRRRAG